MSLTEKKHLSNKKIVLSLICSLFFLQSHAGKVVLRSWYERNKHIFPASRWEPYDPEKTWAKYTVIINNYWIRFL